MNAFTLLKTDHKKVSQLFKKIESASDSSSKAQLFSQLKSELDLHAHIEEKFLYPALENKEKSREITLEAYEEHNVIKELLSELATQAPSDEWDAKLTVLKENVEHHVEEEEGELFDKAENVLSKEQIDRLGVEMEAEKGAQNGSNPKRTPAKVRADGSKKAPARSKVKAKPAGVLSRLANLVGLGGSPTPVAKKTGSRKGAKKSSTKAGTAKKAAKKGGRKTTAKTASKSGVARKTAAAKKTAKRQSGTAKKGGKSAARGSKKASKKTASKKK